MKIMWGWGVLLLLSGCQQGASDRQGTAHAAGSGDLVECRAAGQWARDCAAERDGDLLTLRHPDGGFRRLRILSDGRGLEAADGSEPARVTIIDGQRIEVTVGTDAYRLPAQIAKR